MRCRACNVILTEQEMTRRYKREDPKVLDYVDLCNTDFEYIKDQVQVVESKEFKDESYEDDDVSE